MKNDTGKTKKEKRPRARLSNKPDARDGLQLRVIRNVMRKKKKQFRIALVSSKNLPGEIEKNVDNHTYWIGKAAAQGVRFIGFPECSLTGYTCRKEDAISVKGEEIRLIAGMARQYDVYVSIGLQEKKGRQFFNTHLVVGPKGVIGAMRKINLTTGDRRIFSSGREFPIFDIGPTRLGIAICADARVFETCRVLFLRGAEVIFAPYAMSGKNPILFVNKLSKRWDYYAQECGAYFLGCNNAGRFEKSRLGETFLDFTSGALVVSPDGEIVDRSHIRINREVMIVSNLRLDTLAKKRNQCGSLGAFKADRYYGSRVK